MAKLIGNRLLTHGYYNAATSGGEAVSAAGNGVAYQLSGVLQLSWLACWRRNISSISRAGVKICQYLAAKLYGNGVALAAGCM
jgi:hypothetical protein